MGGKSFFASLSNFLYTLLNFVEVYHQMGHGLFQFYRGEHWRILLKRQGYNDVGTKNVARCRGLNFRFRRRFVYKKN